ncbi:MAG TPA: thiamine pyrophosphate-binding protein [Methylomirabilota bacterium]|nr:thiamine pyrophosphate-binding protein [Methylomirabilota bacterium]
MAQVDGSQLMAEGLKEEGVDTIFYIMGGPNILLSMHAERLGIRLIDVRHEQAAAMMAHAYSRVTGKVGVCMGAGGPGAANLLTGVANAFLDACPVLALGGSSAVHYYDLGDFQEFDQLAVFKPICKWSARVYESHRAKEYVHMAMVRARQGKPGPVYLDMPGNMLVEKVDERRVWPRPTISDKSLPVADSRSIEKAVGLLKNAKKPLLITGSGVFWSGAGEEMRRFIETTGIPFFTTPQGRGVVPDDHPLCLLGARSFAFKEADVVLVVGTRFNFIIGYGRPPRFSPEAKFIQVDVDSEEIGRTRSVELGIVGDAKAVFQQLTEVAKGRVRFGEESMWVQQLGAKDRENREKMTPLLNSEQTPVHPMRLCKEVRDFIPRNGILAVDGHEIMNMSRQVIPSFTPGARLNPGPNGCMGVGLPFGVGAKAAAPDRPVVVLHGDGSLGLNLMELDTAVRHHLPLLVVVSNNGGWTASPGNKMRVPGRDLGFVRYDQVAQGLGAYGELVEDPRAVRPAMERAWREVEKGRPALLNVITEPTARAQTVPFASYGGESAGTSLM